MAVTIITAVFLIIQCNNVIHFQLLSKISAAWQWTVCRRIGLFAADLKVESPLAAFSDSRSPPTPPNVAPHDIWIKFLARRFQVIKYYSYDQVSYNKTPSVVGGGKGPLYEKIGDARCLA